LRVLARFDDGREALVESTFGAGRVVAFTSSLDGLMSDLPVQPLFLPLIHELGRYAASHQDTPLFHRIGTAVDFHKKKASALDPVTFVTGPDGEKRAVSADAGGVEVQQPGFYEALHASGARTVVAADLDIAESDLTALDSAELQMALRPANRTTDAAPGVQAPGADARRGWWRAALVAMLLLMIAEAIAANARGQKLAS